MHVNISLLFVVLFETETPSSCFGAKVEICGKVWRKNHSAELSEHEKHFQLLKLVLNPDDVFKSRNIGNSRIPAEVAHRTVER